MSRKLAWWSADCTHGLLRVSLLSGERGRPLVDASFVFLLMRPSDRAMYAFTVGCLLLVFICDISETILQEDMLNVTSTTLSTYKSSSDTPLTFTPGPSIRLPGKGVGSWKEISLSRPRGTNARYTNIDNTTTSGSGIFICNVWITTLLVAWHILS